MSMGLPAGYHVQASCATCRYRFEYADYDIGVDLFCTADGSARPKCGSLALHEDFTDPLATADEYKAWEQWSEDHHVDPSAICSQYKEAS